MTRIHVCLKTRGQTGGTGVVHGRGAVRTEGVLTIPLVVVEVGIVGRGSHCADSRTLTTTGATMTVKDLRSLVKGHPIVTLVGVLRTEGSSRGC